MGFIMNKCEQKNMHCDSPMTGKDPGCTGWGNWVYMYEAPGDWLPKQFYAQYPGVCQ